MSVRTIPADVIPLPRKTTAPFTLSVQSASRGCEIPPRNGLSPSVKRRRHCTRYSYGTIFSERTRTCAPVVRQKSSNPFTWCWAFRVIGPKSS